MAVASTAVRRTLDLAWPRANATPCLNVCGKKSHLCLDGGGAFVQESILASWMATARRIVPAKPGSTQGLQAFVKLGVSLFPEPHP